VVSNVNRLFLRNPFRAKDAHRIGLRFLAGYPPEF